MISICFILLLMISMITQSYGQVTCASGWVQNGGKCYSIGPVFNSGSKRGTWDQCNAYCPTSYPGAMMLCVNNAAENEWIRSQYEEYENYNWIGYTDMLPYGGGKGTKQYGWVTGCTSTYTNWEAGQPNNQNNNQDYAALNPYNGGQWSDLSPQYQLLCGCEYNAALPKTPSSRPSTAPSSRPSTIPSFGPTVAPSSSPTVAPSPAPTAAPSSPTATPSFRPSVGAVSE